MTKCLSSLHINNYVIETYSDRPDFKVIEVNQVHENEVLNDFEVNSNSKADGIISSDLKTPLAIRTADCLPIIFIGEEGVANIHAGWRGLAKEILLNDLIEQIKPTHVYIGAHIREVSFDVSDDFKENFPNSPFFKENNGKLFFNMEEEAIRQIKSKFKNIEVITSNVCTYQDLEYNSYRRDKTNIRNWNIIKRN